MARTSGTPKPSVVFETPDLAVPGKVLSAAEVDFFIDNGFLVKKNLLDAAPLASAMDRIWSHLLDRVPLAEGTLSRDDRASWRDPRWGPMPPVEASGPYQGRQPVVYSGATVKLHDLGDADYLLRLVPNNPRVRRVAAALLGDDLRPSERTRGVYAIFPTDAGAKTLGPHTDRVCQQLNACVYLDDVPPRGGGFTVYPGSHRIMFRAHRYQANWSPLPSFGEAVSKALANIEPVEFAEEKGTVIFWHGRTIHSSGIHRGCGIRWALFADFTRDRDVLSPDEHREVHQYEWFKDAKLFRKDTEAGDDMWRDWNIGPVATSG